MTGCQYFREHLSADLDGEVGPTGPGDGAAALAAAQRHLAGCAACTRWFADVTRINRLVRTAPAEPGPGLTTAQMDDLLALLPAPARTGPPRWRAVARVALGLLGLAQVVVGALALVVPHGGDTGHGAHGAHAGLSASGMVHMSHEYAAWSIAVGIAFVVGAAWTRHLAGALPVLASFVGVLVTVSVVDLVDGTVDADRVASHVLIVLGLALIVAIVVADARHPDTGPSRGVREARPAGEPVWGGADADLGPVAGEGSSEPAARHRAA
jgi:predicted anti-sigma-YlaC factor YlaD